MRSQHRSSVVRKLALVTLTALIVSLITIAAVGAESRLRTLRSKMAPDDLQTALVPRDISQDFAPVAELRPVHFDFDKAKARAADAKILDADAEWLKANSSYPILIEGYADQRGTDRYNLALAERRAEFVRDQLVARGIPAGRISVVTYGETRPACRQPIGSCMPQNRRAEILVARSDNQRP